MSYRFRNRHPRPGPRPGHRPAPPPPGPDTGPARRRPGPRTVLCQLLICLTVSLGLSSRHLEATASSLPFGAERSVALAVARPLHRLAEASGLDRADRAVAHLLGRSAEEPADPADAGPIEAAAGDGGTRSPSDAAPLPAAPTADASPPGTAASGGSASAEPVRYGPPPPGDPTTATAPAAVDPASAAAPGGAAPGPVAAPAGDGTMPTPTLSVQAPLDPTSPAAPAPGLGPAVIDPMVAAGPPRAVSPEARLRLWAGGDSLGEYVGNQLLAPLSNRALTAVELDFHIGTGLTRPDTYDWEARIDEIMARPDRPEALVFMVGGNDNQPMRAGGQNLDVGSAPWLAEYRARVVDLMDSTRPPDGGAGTHLWWIGLPPMRDGERDGLARAIDALVSEEAAGRPWVTFVDLMPRFSGADGGFAGTITGPDGKAKVARAPDGIHITYAGSTWIAEDLWAEIAARWVL